MSKIERDNRHKRPRRKGRPARGPHEKTIGLCESVHERAILIADGSDAIPGKLRPHVMLTLAIRLNRDGKPNGARFVAAWRPRKRSSSGFKKTRAQMTAETDCRHAQDALTAQEAEHDRLAWAHRDAKHLEPRAHIFERAANQSCSPTDAPPMVRRTSAFCPSRTQAARLSLCPARGREEGGRRPRLRWRPSCPQELMK